MPEQHPIQDNFNAGEWSPKMYGRVTLDKYRNACRTLKNFNILPQGGIEKRGGSKYIAEVKDSTKATRVVKFTFSRTINYILEFGDQYIRFYKDLAQITSGGPAYEIATPYLEAELFQLKFAQSADVIYITHVNHYPAKLSRISDTNWTLADEDFRPPPFEERPEVLDTPASFHPYMFFAFSLFAAGDTATVTARTNTGSGFVDANFFTADMVGTIFQLRSPITDATQWKSGIPYSATTEVYYGDNLYITDLGGSNSGNEPPVHLEGDKKGDGDVTWRYVNSGFGYAEMTAYISPTQATFDVYVSLAKTYGTTNGNNEIGMEIWRYDTDYPTDVALFEERLWFGGSNTYPQTVWASVTGDFPNYTTGTKDDSSLEYTISSDEINTIQWIVPVKSLTIGTIGGEFILTTGRLGDPITPSNVRIVRETSYGCSNIEPIKVASILLYVQESDRKIREMQYDSSTDSFVSGDLTILSDHLFQSDIKEIVHQKNEYERILVVNDNGQIISYTYLKSQDVNGASRYELGGTSAVVESIAVIPSSTSNGVDEIWLVVSRTINGATKRYIEVILPGIEDASLVEDATYVDSYFTYSGASTTSITGLGHLEGETVSILADGATHPDKVVSSGAITLDRAVTKAQVGLAYEAELETMNIEAGVSQGDTAQGQKKRIPKLAVRLLDTNNLQAGGASDLLDEIPFRDSSMAMNSPVPLFSGDKTFALNSRHGEEGRVILKSVLPLPCTILALMQKVSTEMS